MLKCPYCNSLQTFVTSHGNYTNNSKKRNFTDAYVTLTKIYNTDSILRRYRKCLTYNQTFITVEVYTPTNKKEDNKHDK